MDNFISERRTSNRLDMEKQPVNIAWTDTEEQTRQGLCTCIDVSKQGLLFEYTMALPIGTLVEVTFNAGTQKQNTIFGKVIRIESTQNFVFQIALQLLTNK